MKMIEIRKELVVGEVRCLNHSPDMSRRIYDLNQKRTNW